MQLHRLIIVPAFLWEVLFASSTFAFIVNTRTAKFASAHWRDLVVVAAAMKGPIVQPPNRPNACTYWVSENLMAGEYPGGKYGDDNRTTELRLQRYLSAGITVFLDLTNQGEKNDYSEALHKQAKAQGKPAQYKRLPIQDFGVPTFQRMKEILDFIDHTITNGEKVYVHCRGGIGRTGTVVGCFLVRHGNSGEQALDEVNRLFQSSERSLESSYSPETIEQMNFVRGWTE